MYVPAPPPMLSRPMTGMGVVSFALGLMVTFGLIMYATWMAVAAVTAVSATQHSAGAGQHSTATSPPVAALPMVPTPSGSTIVFDQLWASSDGNTIVAGAPARGASAHEGQSVIRVPVTLINNSERAWNPASMTFTGTLNGAPAPEATEGDWMYSTLIVGHTSVTLTKVFVGGPGQFDLTVSTPSGVAVFTGQV